MGSCRAVSVHLIALQKKKRNWVRPTSLLQSDVTVAVRRHCCSLEKEKRTQCRISHGMRNCTTYLREELDSNGVATCVLHAKGKKYNLKEVSWVSCACCQSCCWPRICLQWLFRFTYTLWRWTWYEIQFKLEIGTATPWEFEIFSRTEKNLVRKRWNFLCVFMFVEFNPRFFYVKWVNNIFLRLCFRLKSCPRARSVLERVKNDQCEPPSNSWLIDWLIRWFLKLLQTSDRLIDWLIPETPSKSRLNSDIFSSSVHFILFLWVFSLGFLPSKKKNAARSDRIVSRWHWRPRNYNDHGECHDWEVSLDRFQQKIFSWKACRFSGITANFSTLFVYSLIAGFVFERRLRPEIVADLSLQGMTLLASIILATHLLFFRLLMVCFYFLRVDAKGNVLKHHRSVSSYELKDGDKVYLAKSEFRFFCLWDRLIDWLIDWLFHGLIDWLIDERGYWSIKQSIVEYRA